MTTIGRSTRERPPKRHTEVRFAGAESSAGLLGASVVAGAGGGPDTVSVEFVAGGRITDRSRGATEACRCHGAIRSVARPVRATTDLIAKVMTSWKQT